MRYSSFSSRYNGTCVSNVFFQAPPQTTPAPIEGRCPKNITYWKWLSYGDYCYGAYTLTTTFDSAQASCRSAGGPSANLASHSNLEGRFIASMFTAEYWIGLRKDERGSSQK